MLITWKTITLETAKSAIKAYNDGKYRGESNPEVDRRARQTFEQGLGSSYEEILRQVDFIGKDYGGVAGQPGAITLARSVADDIYRNRSEYEKAATEARPISQQIVSRNTVDILYSPFIKPYGRSEKWQVWGSKFWHFLNPNAFPIADSRVNKFLGLYSWTNSVQMYLEKS